MLFQTPNIDYNPVNTDQEISSVTNTSCVDVISIMINDDLIPETQQQFTIEIVSAETFVNITRESATIYIEDNDSTYACIYVVYF